MDISGKILSDPVNKWVFSRAGEDTFLVGGYIRDLLCKRINKDRDFVLRDNVRQIALEAARKFKGTFIEFKKNLTCRVALKSGHFIDFSQMQNTILEDLHNRDFTINAIAWSPHTGIIDPLNGIRDLKERIIRVVRPENLASDPLRVLRAYRLACQLGLSIDKKTRHFLRDNAIGLVNVAPERITQELFKILNNENAGEYLNLCYKDKVLHEIINLSPRILRKNLLLISDFDRFLLKIKKGKYQNINKIKILRILRRLIGQGLVSQGLIRLYLLMHKQTDSFNNTRTLTLSNLIRKRLKNINRALSISTGRLTSNKLYEIFDAANMCEYEVTILISVVIRHGNVDKLIRRAEDFIRIKKYKLINGHEIQRILNKGPEELIGLIQHEVQRRYYSGKIKNKAEARRWITSNFT